MQRGRGSLADTLFIGPVRGYAELGDLVHPLGTNLHLDRLPLKTDDGGVQRLIAVGFGNRHVILKAARNRRPDRVDDAERPVTDRFFLVFGAQIFSGQLSGAQVSGSQVSGTRHVSVGYWNT